MRTCIYCRKEKSDDNFTLEHVIPQFLGGQFAPDRFKVRDVCGPCNNNLGLFVDGSFERTIFVATSLRLTDFAHFDPNDPAALPLICMGDSGLVLPGQASDEICESWLGPLGEQVFWVRKHEEKFYWYSGGNPITMKQKKSRAYFIFSVKTLAAPLITKRAFQAAFKGTRAKKVLMCRTDGVPGEWADLGFDSSDSLDYQRIEFFSALANQATAGHRNRASINITFDYRFMCKLAVGVAYSLFGKKSLETKYASELHKGVWHKEGQPTPQVMGQTHYNSEDGADSDEFHLWRYFGFPHAPTLCIQVFPEGVALNLQIGESYGWSILCASLENLTPEDLALIGDGLVLVLCRAANKVISLPFIDFIAHKLPDSTYKHSGLLDIEHRAARNKAYLTSLPK